MLLAYAHFRKLRVLRWGQLAEPLGLSRTQERKLFHRMFQAGLIARVRKGLYLVPPRLPLGGKWSPEEVLAINVLMRDLKGRYQVSGPNAFNRYGFDEQIPNRVYVYNNRLSGERKIGSVALTLIKVADKRLGGTEKFKTLDGEIFVYSSRSRTLVDAVYDWSRFNSLPRAYGWIRSELATKRVDPEALVKMASAFGNANTIRRVGALLDRVGVEERLLRKLERRLKPTTAFIPWIPKKPKRGKVNRRWGVVLNEQG